MAVEIIPASFRDLSYVAANIRPEDKAECEAQMGEIHYMDLAAMHLRDFTNIALLDDNPVCAFGACRAQGEHLWAAWSFSTRHVAPAIPAVTRHIKRVMIPEITALPEAQRVEARAMAANVMACRWLRLMGATERCDLPGYGRGGELFKLYDWTR